jgi:hypothetical protein
MEKPTEEEIENKRDEASDAVFDGSPRFQGMSYQEGIRDALEWVLGEAEDELEV